TLQPDPGRGIPLRPDLDQRTPPHHSPSDLEHPLQLPSTTHRRRKPATSLPAPHQRHQRHGLIQLAGGSRYAPRCPGRCARRSSAACAPPTHGPRPRPAQPRHGSAPLAQTLCAGHATGKGAAGVVSTVRRKVSARVLNTMSALVKDPAAPWPGSAVLVKASERVSLGLFELLEAG